MTTSIEGTETTLDTAGNHTKYLRNHFWPDTLGDRYVEGQKGQAITFDELLAQWGAITINEGSTIDLSSF